MGSPARGTARSRPLAVVTGASSGIGASFARVLASAGHDLLLVARRAEQLELLGHELEQRHGIHAQGRALDLSEPTAAASLSESVADQSGRAVSVLVNNAGYALDGRLLDSQWAAHAQLLRLMLETPTELVHRLLPGMLDAGSGRVITIASLGGLMHSTPQQTLYGPVKHYAIALSRTLAEEYRGTGVTFTAVCPGFTRTGMITVGAAAAASERLPKWLIASPDAVARSGWGAAERGQLVHVPGFSNRLAALAIRLLPTDLGDRLLTRTFDRLTSRH